MRWILADDVEDELPGDWDDVVAAAISSVEQKAQKAREAAQAKGKTAEEVEEACRVGRQNAIGKSGKVWSRASAALRSASDGKCWYCEKKPSRSDMPVDHFRPKASVHGAAEHTGYWWLAFEWQNFRLSCTFCNSRRRDVVTGLTGGKQDYFPILEPPSRQFSATDADDRPMLLDPLVDSDTKLLSFHPNGRSAPSNDDKEHDDHLRAETSIELYHLNHSAIVRERKTLARQIRQLVEEGEKAVAAGDDHTRRLRKKDIVKLTRCKAELSTAARFYLGTYRNLPWVEEIFERDF